jgi:uncharacterized protein DUF2845
MNGNSSKYFTLVAAIFFAFSLLIAAIAFALPCQDQTVDIGETTNEVSAKCGEARLKEQWTVKVEKTDAKGAASITVKTIDEWTYDTGPDDLLQTYRFEGGKVVGIANPGYGRARDFAADPCRNGESLKVGDTPVETYLKCGEPLAKEKRADKVIESESDGEMRRTTLSVVEWTYRYGRDLPGYTITFENGVASSIRTREFGK